MSWQIKKGEVVGSYPPIFFTFIINMNVYDMSLIVHFFKNYHIFMSYKKDVNILFLYHI